jgi:two-component system cell cycle response regulator
VLSCVLCQQSLLGVFLNIRFKLNIVLAITFLLALMATSFLIDRSLQQNAMDNSKATAIKQMETAMAVRKYTTDHVREPLLADTEEFHAAAVPSFSANKVMEYLEAVYPSYSYREVAINPTNPKDKANAWEKGMIASFQRNPSQTEIFHITEDEGNKFLNYLKPIQIQSESCLQCHGDPDTAPATMLKKYGSKNGFGWNLDDIVGAQVVSVPMSVPLAESRRSLVTYISSLCVICSLFFLLLNLMLTRVIISPIQSTQENLERMVNRDHLTGVLNRRGFEDVLKQCVERADASHSPLCVIFCDLDRFKSINDTFGHDVGDSVLKEFADRIGGALRRQDRLGRLGGEEFALILPQTKKEGAVIFAEVLRGLVAETPFSVAGKVTSSFGIAELGEGISWTTLLKNADLALYQAKENGRNRVELYAG